MTWKDGYPLTHPPIHNHIFIYNANVDRLWGFVCGEVGLHAFLCEWLMPLRGNVGKGSHWCRISCHLFYLVHFTPWLGLINGNLGIKHGFSLWRFVLISAVILFCFRWVFLPTLKFKKKKKITAIKTPLGKRRMFIFTLSVDLSM